MRHLNNRRVCGFWLVVLSVVSIAAVGCATTRPVSLSEQQIDDAVAALTRPLPGDLAAVYRMRVAKSGGMRVAVIAAGDAGRMTVSEPFGAAVSLTAWTPGAPSVFFDMDAGCRREVDDLREILGLRALPLGQAARLLGGRLPTMPGDRITRGAGSRIELRGSGWAAEVVVAADPWRVVEVSELQAGDARGWLIELDEHTSSVPGRIRVTNPDGRWAELELKRLEWPDGASLPDLPDFRPCGAP